MSIDPTVWAWGGFIAFILFMLALDLGVLNRRVHVVSIREAMLFTLVCVALALVFSGFLYFAYDRHIADLGLVVDPIDGVNNDGRLAWVKFVTGYLIELSLSADNVFVMAMLFAFLRVPNQFQHRVLFWGILGALVMRGVMIVLGASLVARYHWVLYVFGAFLVYTAIRLFMARDIGAEEAPPEPAVLRIIRRWVPITTAYHGSHFVVRLDGRLFLTPLAVALVFIETTDLVFAVDSIPAIFAITADPFLIFTSNVFAILGLRSLYFALAGAIEKFRYLRASLAIILAIVGVKMLVAELLKAWIGPSATFYLLGLVASILAAGVVASMLNPVTVEKGTPPREGQLGEQ
ncbi:MAG: TerC family protein [Gemmatimonadaceae bacterium]